MRNYSRMVNTRNTVAIDIDFCKANREYVEDMLTRRLLKLFEVRKLSELCPSEESVLIDLSCWVDNLCTAEFLTNPILYGSFVYVNLNTGESLVLVADYGYGTYAVTGCL